MFSPNSTTSPLVCDFFSLSHSLSVTKMKFFDSFHKMSCSLSLSSLMHWSWWRRWLRILNFDECLSYKENTELFQKRLCAFYRVTHAHLENWGTLVNFECCTLDRRRRVCIYASCCACSDWGNNKTYCFTLSVDRQCSFFFLSISLLYQEWRKKKKTSQRNTIITIN